MKLEVPKLYLSIISGGGSSEKGGNVQFISVNRSGRFCFIVASKLKGRLVRTG